MFFTTALTGFIILAAVGLGALLALFSFGQPLKETVDYIFGCIGLIILVSGVLYGVYDHDKYLEQEKEKANLIKMEKQQVERSLHEQYDDDEIEILRYSKWKSYDNYDTFFVLINDVKRTVYYIKDSGNVKVQEEPIRKTEVTNDEFNVHIVD